MPEHPDDSRAPRPHVTVEELLRERLSAALGGWRGAVESALPTVAFVVAWNVTQDVTRAALLAVVVAVLVAGVRLVQGQTLRYAGYSLFAVVLTAAVATRTGRAQDAFLPGILMSVGNVILFAGANFARWPLFGFLIAAGDPDLARTAAAVRSAGSRATRAERATLPEDERTALEAADEAAATELNQAFVRWRRHPGIVKVASRLGWILVGLALVRLSIQVPLYLQGSVEALGIAKIVLGWPAYLVAVAIAALMLMRGRTPLDGPEDPDSPDSPDSPDPAAGSPDATRA